MVSFLEILIEVYCGEGRHTLTQVAQSRWIWLPREYIFQRMDSDWRGVGEMAAVI
jgi:hypothetical protein